MTAQTEITLVCAFLAGLVLAESGIARAEGGIQFKQYYAGVPNYAELRLFESRSIKLNSELRRLVSEAAVADSPCRRGVLTPTAGSERILESNLCDGVSFDPIKALLRTLAPGLNANQMTFWKTDLDSDGRAELLVEYVDLAGQDVTDAYLSLWLLRIVNDRLLVSYAGPYLSGRIHTYQPFGDASSRRKVFVRYQSCTECHPWIFLSAIDFFATPQAEVFLFNYSKRQKEFVKSLEYRLPGHGHSIDAEVETRAVEPTLLGPHLIQQFRLAKGGSEWWVFSCLRLRCDHQMFLNELPSEYAHLWARGSGL